MHEVRGEQCDRPQSDMRVVRGVVVATDGQRWGGDGERETGLVMDRQTEGERKKGSDKDKDISHI